MSTTAPYDISCGFCGGRFSTDLFWGLHVTRAPEVRDAILSGQFQRFACPHCGRSVVVEPTMLYTDFDRGHWLGIFPQRALLHRKELAAEVQASFQRNMELAAPPMVRAWAPAFRQRCLFGLPALRERLLIWEEGLDDGLFECLKMQLLAGLGLDLLHWRTDAWLVKREGDSWIFAIASPGDARDGSVVEHHIRVHREQYDVLVAKKTELMVSFPDLFAGLLVDWRCAFAPEEPLARVEGEPQPYPLLAPG